MKTSQVKTGSKLLFKILLAISILIANPLKSNAQVLKRLKKKVEKTTEKQINKEIDKAGDAIYNTDKTKVDSIAKTTNSEKNKESVLLETQQKPKVIWNKFDFVPGDTVIFEDGPSADEENGEFPSRWDLFKGNVEIGEVDGENVIMFISSSSYIIPYLKNSNEDYLPDVFTIELDVWFAKGQTTANRFWIYLCDKKNNSKKTEELVVMPHGLDFASSSKAYPGTENLGWSKETVGSWKHISMAYTKGKFKAYFNDTRLINVPHLEINPSGITLRAGNDNMYIKNIRIAKGGIKYYDRVLSDGKIIVNGIKFDVNKATLKPESMGPINKIFKLMQKQTDLNFSVEGHTDSDGGDDANMTLSKARGKTVMDQIIAMGISEDRLKSNGFGESKPLDNNSTPEGKANNRRVEFVKF